MNSTETIFFKIGKAAFLPILAGMFFLHRIEVETLQTFPLCTFYQITGRYCPGCGMTRALFSLAHGNWVISLRYHPVVLCAFLFYFIFMLFVILKKRSGRRIRISTKPEYFCYVCIAVILLQWVLKLLGFWVMP